MKTLRLTWGLVFLVAMFIVALVILLVAIRCSASMAAVMACS